MHQNNLQRSPKTRSRTFRNMSSKNMASKRTVFNCIVDDSALLAGVTDMSRSNIPAWLEDRFINVFVPLYTLEKLNSLKLSSDFVSNDAQATLEWLDTITTKTENRKSGRVELQGPEDQYETWAEVEKYLLPETPLASQDHKISADNLAGNLAGSLTIEPLSNGIPQDLGDIPRSLSSSTAGSTKSPPKSTGLEAIEDSASASGSLVAVDDTGSENEANATVAVANGVTSALVKALLNYVVWRTHHETSLSPGHYLLLTNDATTQQQAKKFGIRAKSVNQLRSVISRDNSKYGRPRSSTGSDIQKHEHPINEEEDEIVFQGSHRHSSSQSSNTPDIWDPDQFGRGPKPKNGTVKSMNETSQPSPADPARRKSRGNSRGATATQPRGPRRATNAQQARQPYARPIDPDSYDRSTPSTRRGGRSAHRRLWEPN